MPSQFQDVFDQLSELLRETAPGMVVTGEGTPTLTLMTTWNEGRTRRPAWFAQVATKKSYVSFHLMPLDALPALREAIHPTWKDTGKARPASISESPPQRLSRRFAS